MKQQNVIGSSWRSWAMSAQCLTSNQIIEIQDRSEITDGYYESLLEVFEGNLLEITI